MPEIYQPQQVRFPGPVEPPVVPINFGNTGSAHPSVAQPYNPPWMNLLQRPASPGEMISGQELAMKMRQQGQQQQGRNALAQLFSDPNNVDENGALKPEALRSLGAQGFGKEALEIMGTQADIARGQMATRASGQKFLEAEQQRILGEFEPLVAEYDNNVKTLGPERAKQVGQERYAELVAKARQSGAYSPQVLDRIRPDFDPERLRANILGLKGVEDRAQKNRAEERANIDTNIKQTEAERKTFGEPKYTGKVDGKDVSLIYRPGQGYFDTNGTKVENATNIHHMGSKDTEQEPFHPSKEIAVVDKDGNVVERFAARETRNGWIRPDTGEAVKVPPGGKIDVGQAAGAVIGSRENVYIGRILEGGITATADLENISKMPVTVTSGIFGGRKQGPGLLDATKEVLANQLTSQDVQIYNSANTGIQRALAVIESSGLAPSGAFTEQFQGLTLKEGDTQLARLYKMANARQIVENGMEVIKANPRVAPEQKKLADQFVKRVEAAIPWTTSDVIKLQTADDPTATLHNLGVAKTAGKEATKESAAPVAPSAAAGVITSKEQYDALPSGAQYRKAGDPEGYARTKP